MRPHFLGSVIVGLTCCAAMIAAQSAGGEADFPVKASATAGKTGADGKQTVTVTLAIDKNWYIYANPVGGPKDYAQNRTLVSFKAKEKVTADSKYPAGKLKIDTDGKDPIEYRIYADRVVVQCTVQRTTGDVSPLQVNIDVNTCKEPSKVGGTDGLCLPLKTLRLTLPQ